MALNIESAKDRTAYDALLKRIDGEHRNDYEARYDYAPSDALLQPLEELPGDSQFLTTYRPRGTSEPMLAADFAKVSTFGPEHATALMAMASLRQVILGAIDKQPLTYFIGPEAVTQEVLGQVTQTIDANGRERIDDKNLHLLCRQIVYAGTDLTQYDRIVLMVRVKTARKSSPTEDDGDGSNLRAKSKSQWKARRDEMMREKPENEGMLERAISVAMTKGDSFGVAQLRKKLQDVRASVDTQLAAERKEEAEALAKSRRDAVAKLRDDVNGRQPGWVLAVFDNMPERDDGLGVHIISALPGAQELPDTIAEAKASGLPISVEALRLVPRLLAGVFREYYSTTPVGAYHEFEAAAYPRRDRLTLNSADRRSLPLMFYYIGTLSRTHKMPVDELRSDPFDAVFNDPEQGKKNLEAMILSLRLSLGLRRFRETEVDNLVEPYALSLDQQNAKPTGRPRLVPLDYLSRAASERNPAVGRKLERAADLLAKSGQLPSLDSTAASKAAPVAVYKSPASAPQQVVHSTEYDVALRPFMAALGGLFGQRWNNSYFGQTVALDKLLKDVAESNSKPHELCNVFPLYALMPPPSMMLQDDVLRYLRMDRNRLDAVDRYIAAHRSSASTEAERAVDPAWDAIVKYVAEVRRAEDPDRALLKANVDRLLQFVDDREYSTKVDGRAPVLSALERRFLITGEEAYRPLWAIVKDRGQRLLETQPALRHMTYAQQLEAMLIDLRVGLAGKGNLDAAEKSVALLAVLLPFVALASPPLKDVNKQMRKIVGIALEVDAKTADLSVDYSWGPRSIALHRAIDAATPSGSVGEFEAAVGYLPGEALAGVRRDLRDLSGEAARIFEYVAKFVKDTRSEVDTLVLIGRLAVRSAPHVVRVRTLAELSKANTLESVVVATNDAAMLPANAQFGELQATLHRNTAKLGEALWGKDPELREIELRLAHVKNDPVKLAEASYDMDVYAQRAQSINHLKNEALAEAAYVRSQRRGRIVNVYAQTPALVYRYTCARQFALFSELFALVSRNPDFWASFAYSENEVQNTQQTFGRLASLPLAQWNVKDIEEARALLVSEVDRENGQSIQRAHGIDEVLLDSAIVRDVARVLVADQITRRPNGLRGAEAAFLAFGRGYYASVRSLIDILRELRDDVSLVEDGEHSVAVVAIDDLLHETSRKLRDLDEMRQTISEAEDYSGEAVVAQRRLTGLRYLLRDRYFYEVAPQSSSNPRSVGDKTLDQVAYGAFGRNNTGVSIGIVEYDSDNYHADDTSGCIVKRFEVPKEVSAQLKKKKEGENAGHLSDVSLCVYIDHSGFLATTESGRRLRNFLAAVFIEGGIKYELEESEGADFHYWTGMDDRRIGVASIAEAMFSGESVRRSLWEALEPFQDQYGISWNKDLGSDVFDHLNSRGFVRRPYSDDAVATALREVLAQRMSVIEDLCDLLHRTVPTARDANLYRASVMLVLTRKRPDGTVNVTTASVGDLSMMAMTYPLVTDSRNVARTYERVRDVQADELADAEAISNAIRALVGLKDSKVRKEVAAKVADVLDEVTKVKVPPDERDDPIKVAAYLEHIYPDSLDTFKAPANFATLFARLNDIVSPQSASHEIYNAEAEAKVEISNQLSGGARFSPDEARQRLLELQHDLAEMTNEDDRSKASRALALDIALYDYLVEIGSGCNEATTIVTRAEGADSVVAGPLRRVLDQTPMLRASNFSEILRGLPPQPDANLRAYLDRSLDLRSFRPIDDDVDSLQQQNFIRQVLENERSHLEQAARASVAHLQAALERFGFNIPLLRRRENRAEVPVFFYISEVTNGYVPSRRERIQTLALLAQLVRIDSPSLKTVKRVYDSLGKTRLQEFTLPKDRILVLLSSEAKNSDWVLGYSSTSMIDIKEEKIAKPELAYITGRAALEKMVELQQLVQAAFSVASQRQMLPVVRALRNMGSSSDDLDTRVPLPMPMATANTPRDGERYREQVLVDKNSIAKVSLLPTDLFWRPFTVVEFDTLSERLKAVRGKRGSTDDLLEEYFSRISLVCGVERSPFSMGNLWLKRRECAATFEQIRTYAEANGSGPLYAEYLAGRYVSEDSRLLPIVSVDPTDLVRVSSYDLTTADRAYFVVSGNFSRFLPVGLLAEMARRAAHRLEAHLSIEALDKATRTRLTDLKTKKNRVEDRDQLAAALGSRLAADEVLIAASAPDRKAYLKQYDRRAFGTDNPALFAKSMLNTMQARFKMRVDSIMHDVLRRDASTAGDKMQPIEPDKADAAVRSPLNAEFGLMYFGPLAPAAAPDLEAARMELSRVLGAEHLFDPDVRYAPKNEGQTDTNSRARMVTARHRFLLHVG